MKKKYIRPVSMVYDVEEMESFMTASLERQEQVEAGGWAWARENNAEEKGPGQSLWDKEW